MNHKQYQTNWMLLYCCTFVFFFSVPQKPGTEINVISIEPGMDDTSLQDDLEYLADLAIPNAVLGFVSVECTLIMMHFHMIKFWMIL